MVSPNPAKLARPPLVNPANLPTFHRLLQQCSPRCAELRLNPPQLDSHNSQHGAIEPIRHIAGTLPGETEMQTLDGMKSNGK